MQARLLGLALVAMIVASSVPLCSAADGLRWSAARRTIDLTTQVVRMTTEADLVNAGKADVATVLFGVDADHADSIAWVEAQETDAKDTLKTAKVDAPAGAPAGSVFYQVTLSKALAEDDAVTIAFTAVITNAQTPSPAKLKQDETQKVQNFILLLLLFLLLLLLLLLVYCCLVQSLFCAHVICVPCPFIFVVPFFVFSLNI